nr:type II toxin-antitoxin system HigB family toxin [Chamaesiphon sp. VAR_48_metabat_135_sub]
MIAISRLREAAAKYPDVAIQTEDWNEIVKIATWQNLIEVQQTYTSAEAVENFTVFNIKGNRYRLIVSINYPKQLVSEVIDGKRSI